MATIFFKYLFTNAAIQLQPATLVLKHSFFAMRSKRFFYRFTVVVLCGMALLMGYALRRQAKQVAKNFDRETVFKHYPDFAIGLPDGFALHGIDVSRYQQNINWGLVSSMKSNGVQISFAFIKATEGATLLDPNFKRNWQKAKQNGVTRGAYHFFRTGSSGARQARFFINQVKLQKGDLPPVLDIEVAGGAAPVELVEEALIWLNLVEAHYGITPIIYTNAGFYQRYLSAERFERFPLWVAHYTGRREPNIKRSWHFWQHNEGGRVNGIRAFVDFNVFNGDSSSFAGLLVK